jgi:hypothetical protein
MFTPPDNGKADPRPLLVIADSRGRVRCWDAIRKLLKVQFSRGENVSGGDQKHNVFDGAPPHTNI